MRVSILLLGLVLLISSCAISTPNLSDEKAAADNAISDNAVSDIAVSDNAVLDNAVSDNAAADNIEDNGLDKLTEPFKAFLEIMTQREPVSRTETGAAGYVFNLEGGSLSVLDADGIELWRTDTDWWVDDFRLGDVDGDGVEDFVFSLWKSYRFGEAHPARMKNDDETVRNHLFVYTILSGHVKAVWGSSDLPYPIYSFELDPTGRVTTVSSGMLLRTCEGEYREDFAQTASVQRIYAWQGWGFVPLP